MGYLSQRALHGLKDYKYKPGGYTPIDAWHQPHWNYITDNWLPSWLAPNLITLTGMSALITVYIIAAYTGPNYVEPTPVTFYLMYGIANFFYLHMDALDGKQARKTKTSSPLGQLFDHGCDALATHLVLSMMLSTLQLEYCWKAVGSMMYVYIPWLLAHWEEYHTGMMVIGNGFWGVTEANYAVVALHSFTYAVGPQFWLKRPLVKPLEIMSQYVSMSPKTVQTLMGLQANDIFLLVMLFFGISLFKNQVTRVFRLSGSKVLLRTTLPPNERGNKYLGKPAAAFHLAQMAVMYILGTALLLPSSRGQGEARVRMAIFGAIYAMQATRMIVSHMAKEPFTIAVWPLVLIALQTANGVYQWVDYFTMTYAVAGIIVAGYLHYVISIVREICSFLNIRALTIKRAD